MGEQVGEERELRSAERMKFFTDAVVAIAMTLLILPLLESITEASSHGLDTHEWFSEHGSQFFAFALSFAVIATLWTGHERLFDTVGSWSAPLMTLNVMWMASINLLAIATSAVGSFDTDAFQKVFYIGTMIVSTVLMLLMTLVVRRDPRLWDGDEGPTTGSVAAEVAQVLLYVVALALALVPAIGYFAMFLLALTSPLQRVLQRALMRRGS